MSHVLAHLALELFDATHGLMVSLGERAHLLSKLRILKAHISELSQQQFVRRLADDHAGVAMLMMMGCFLLFISTKSVSLRLRMKPTVPIPWVRLYAMVLLQ